MDWDANIVEMQIIAFFGNHVVSPVQMCGFEGNNLVNLRADFGIFADTKHQELPGASTNLFLNFFRSNSFGLIVFRGSFNFFTSIMFLGLHDVSPSIHHPDALARQAHTAARE